jgi:hypothetical protein
LVEGAGEPLSAGWVARLVREARLDGDTLDVGDREVEWELARDAVIVAHAPAGGAAGALRYPVGLLYTDLPSGGVRWWWSCPACRARVDTLYLPRDCDRLACRKCCRLLYESQFTGAKRRRKRRPTVRVIRERLTWTPVSGWVVSRRTERR